MKLEWLCLCDIVATMDKLGHGDGNFVHNNLSALRQVDCQDGGSDISPRQQDSFYRDSRSSDSKVVSGATLLDVPRSSFNMSNLSSAISEEEEVLIFVEPPNRKLFCRICDKVFRDPVIVQCGHTYCRPCVQVRLSTYCWNNYLNTCPWLKFSLYFWFSILDVQFNY